MDRDICKSPHDQPAKDDPFDFSFLDELPPHVQHQQQVAFHQLDSYPIPLVQPSHITFASPWSSPNIPLPPMALPSTSQAPMTRAHLLRTSADVMLLDICHLVLGRTLYVEIQTVNATIEPLVAWLQNSFNDSSISGMVLQYKGMDGLWKCLLNRDDSLNRMLKQAMKKNVPMLYMRIPRQEELLSSGYKDRRLLALAKPRG
ncbi:hypothetical protein DM01DRAFT_1335660 [Hesseltinella vesiculosa]|uniref:Uncharacterized protein n=1 Tax=Hesseltinella vesiculosa TaxID=101127 RepID=A0A1X2GIC7_9FUNG|nr:hypothetical protein DM01DRAFT_1335660 [Hesseltinella vesiculosa]